MTKSLADSGLKPSSVCTDADAAGALAQGHPKSGKPPVKPGMKSPNSGGDLARKE